MAVAVRTGKLRIRTNTLQVLKPHSFPCAAQSTSFSCYFFVRFCLFFSSLTAVIISTNNSSTEDSSKDVELVCNSKDIELDLFYLKLVCDRVRDRYKLDLFYLIRRVMCLNYTTLVSRVHGCVVQS
jgi:hypothetical protein